MYTYGSAILGLAMGLALLPAAAAAHSDEKHDEAQSQEQATPAAAAEQEGGHKMMGTEGMSASNMPNMRMPHMDPQRGKKLFVSKGCVACHAINGVGGHHAANLDAHTMEPMMNPFEFSAKMWAMAPAMIASQEEALGEQILFTGDELADIIAFVHNDEAQHSFTDADLTPEARKMMHHHHDAPGGGAAAHAKELGHNHDEGDTKAHTH